MRFGDCGSSRHSRTVRPITRDPGNSPWSCRCSSGRMSTTSAPAATAASNAAGSGRGGNMRRAAASTSSIERGTSRTLPALRVDLHAAACRLPDRGDGLVVDLVVEGTQQAGHGIRRVMLGRAGQKLVAGGGEDVGLEHPGQLAALFDLLIVQLARRGGV